MAKTATTALGNVTSSTGAVGGGAALGNITILGVAEAIAKFGRVSQLVYRETGLITMRTAQYAQQRAQERVHSSTNVWTAGGKTGADYTDALRDSIGIEKDGVYDWSVFAGTEYAAIEEYHPGHEYLRPALYESVPYAQALLGALAVQIEAI